MVSRGLSLVEAKHACDLVEFLDDAPPAVARRQCLVSNEWSDPLDDLGDRQQTLYAREVYAAFADKVLDYLQAIELIAGVQAHAADRPAWLDEAEPFVFPQSLRMHPEHPGGHADKKKVLIQGCADPSIAIDTTRVNVAEGQYCSVSAFRSPDHCASRRARGTPQRRQRDGPRRARARSSEA